MPTVLALLGNFVIAVAYAAITVAIIVPVVRAGQLRTNRLATATAMIFFSCSVGHALHTLLSVRSVMAGDHMDMGFTAGDWYSSSWDAFTACVGVYYWTLRRGYGVLLGSGSLFIDPEQQRLLAEVRARELEAAGRAETHRAVLAAVVEQSDDAITGTTLDGVVTAWNAGAERMTGYPVAEVIGTDVGTLIAPVDAPDQAELMARIAAGERGIRYDSRILHKDGSTVDVAVSLSPIVNGAGTVVGASRIARDVSATRRAETSQRAAEERAQQAQRMASLGQLAGGVAHDFNNLLGIILNFTAFASEQATDDAIRADLTQVRSAAERAVALAGQLLTFTRQDTIRPEVLDVNASIAEAQAMLARTIGEHIELVALAWPEPLTIHADAGHVQQILVNLAVNARDAMPDGGTLVIEAAAVELDESQANISPAPVGGRYALLLVGDTGTGMSTDVLSHIFEPFYTTKPRGQGTGLGLATVYGIVAEAGGSIDVYSEPGIGTTFRVYFPIVEAPDGPLLPQSATATAPRGHGQAVLVVEDEVALGQATVRILNAGGYRAMFANSGAQALGLDAEYGCDLLLTDVVMPEMSGRQLADLLHERHPQLPVLYMSGYTSGLLGSTRALGEHIAFVEKPFTANLLLTRVNDVFLAGTGAAASALGSAGPAS